MFGVFDRPPGLGGLSPGERGYYKMLVIGINCEKGSFAECKANFHPLKMG